MKFWDTSALAPLLWDEQDSTTRSKELKNDPILVVWWATAVEIESALFRRLAKGEIDELNESHARARLSALAQSWIEIQPTESVREMARRLIRVHGLRTADSFQLAAALVACGNRPKEQTFLSGDSLLKKAASKEGFSCS